jgi:DNA (cytosine-5)-methyltransferase 1
MLKRENFTFIDLFAGIGGFRIVLEELGGKCVFSSEWDKHAQKTYRENFNESPFGDITKLTDKEIREKIPEHEILCGGFPCQAFSISGKQRGFEDTRGTLFFDIVRIVKQKNPMVLFLENVKNLERHNKGATYLKIKSTLDKLGYDVFSKVLNASNFGIPTARKRIYFVCFRKDLEIKEFSFPEGDKKEVYLRNFLDFNADVSEYELLREDIVFHREKEQRSSMKPIQIGKISGGGQGERVYSINGHAITLSAHGGGAAAKTGAYLINNKVRKLTPKECARIMGFPEDFKIPVSDSQAYKQFGNSLAIPVVREIAKKIIQLIN